MDLIVETDIGRDPDDFFALCYLLAAGVQVRAITVSPGDPDQIAVAKFLLNRTGGSAPVAASQPRRNKSSVTPFHAHLLASHSWQRRMRPDGIGAAVIEATVRAYPECDFLIIGPPMATGAFLSRNPECRIARLTLQGGFIGYDVHGLPCRHLPEFERKTSMPSFNLNGDVRGANAVLRAAVGERRIVSKNVCHTVRYGAGIHARICAGHSKGRASELFRIAMDLYVSSRSAARDEGKKFHDPVAAVCHLHPEVATWVHARLRRRERGWGAELDRAGDPITVDIREDTFWEYIAQAI